MPTASPNLQTAIFLAAVCYQTYLQFESQCDSFIVPHGFHHVQSFTGTAFKDHVEDFGFLLESPTQIIIAFRGTISTPDWISDAIARQAPYTFIPSKSMTHQGFTDIYSSIRKQVISELQSLSPEKELLITGHSLGGALATLCAPDSAQHSPFNKPAVYTYGSPRTGDPAFTQLFNRVVAQSARIVNKYDTVPHLPPLSYYSLATKEWYPYLHVKGRLDLSFKEGSVGNNHLISHYFKALSSLDPHFSEMLISCNPGLCPV